MSAWLLLVLLSAHFIGDFMCQSDRMAKGKSTSFAVLGEHVCVYAGVVTVFMMPVIAMYVSTSIDLGVVAARFCVVTMLTHFVTDTITGRINARLWREGRVHDFFVGVGADQLIHAWTLALTWTWIVGGY